MLSNGFGFDKDLSYEEVPVEILYCDVKIVEKQGECFPKGVMGEPPY